VANTVASTVSGTGPRMLKLIHQGKTAMRSTRRQLASSASLISLSIFSRHGGDCAALFFSQVF
jgi:hypothetical protein